MLKQLILKYHEKIESIKTLTEKEKTECQHVNQKKIEILFGTLKCVLVDVYPSFEVLVGFVFDYIFGYEHLPGFEYGVEITDDEKAACTLKNNGIKKLDSYSCGSHSVLYDWHRIKMVPLNPQLIHQYGYSPVIHGENIEAPSPQLNVDWIVIDDRIILVRYYKEWHSFFHIIDNTHLEFGIRTPETTDRNQQQVLKFMPSFRIPGLRRVSNLELTLNPFTLLPEKLEHPFKRLVGSHNDNENNRILTETCMVPLVIGDSGNVRISRHNVIYRLSWTHGYDLRVWPPDFFISNK